jgi:general secretion pathway protein D
MAVMVGAPPGGRAEPDSTRTAAPDAKAAKTDTAGTDAVPEAPGEDDDLYRCGKAKSDVKVSFRPGLELTELATWAMGFTCKNFVYSPVLATRKLSVTVMAPRPMAPRDAWRLFLVALQTMRLTVVEKGQVLEIVEAPTAKKQALPLLREGTRAPGGEELVRVIFRPRQVTSANLAQALAPLASQDGEVSDLAWAGVVLATDYGGHIATMREMLLEVDRPGSDQGLYFLPLRHAAAAELVETLRALLAPGQGQAVTPSPAPQRGNRQAESERAADVAAPARILADERTNSLILLASRAAYDRTRALVERLDVEIEGDGAGSRVHVHRLEHTSAEKIAETLGALLGQRAAPSGAGGSAGSRAPARRSPVATPAAAQSAPAGGPAGPELPVSLQGDVRVTADPLSNSLLVLSSYRDYMALQKILDELDVPRHQVYIEALVIEVASGWQRSVGVAWHGGRVTRNGMWLGALGHGQLTSFLDIGKATEAAGDGAAGLSGFLGGIIGVPIPGADALLGTSIPSFSVLFQALAQSDQVDILSSPHVMTTDHVEAVLASGQTVPFVSGVTGLPGTAGGTLPLVERENVGLTLKVTPHVGGSGQVRLDIDLVLEDLLPQAGELGPSTSKRQITNSVVVADQQSAVLGGLMTHKVSRRETKIPLLGDLPLLGILFRRREREQRKANLVVLVTPYVVTDSLDGVRSVERVLERRGEFLGALERLGEMGYRRRSDGRRLRGLVAEIARRTAQVDEERAVLRQLDPRGPDPAGPIESPVGTNASESTADPAERTVEPVESTDKTVDSTDK